jgi:hypothetical protein
MATPAAGAALHLARCSFCYAMRSESRAAPSPAPRAIATVIFSFCFLELVSIVSYSGPCCSRYKTGKLQWPS